MGGALCPPLIMTTTHTTKMKAIRGLINTWLKDQTLYCNHCDSNVTPLLVYESCCENPQIGRNMDHYRGCCLENKKITDCNMKVTGATKDNSMRASIAIPPRLLFLLEHYFGMYGEKLFNDRRELHEFMKEFPQFKVCEKI